MRRTTALAAALVVATALAGAVAVPRAQAHSNPCHRSHKCPSDHHTYRWRGLLCTSYKKERTKKDTIKVRHGGRTYYCRH